MIEETDRWSTTTLFTSSFVCSGFQAV